MAQMIARAVYCHTARASATTWARNLSGKSPGVSRSTRTPSRVCSSSCRPPKSNKVAPGKASTKISRSLPSRSVPYKAEPKTRGFAAQKRPTMLRTASRLALRAWEGFTGLDYHKSAGNPVAQLVCTALKSSHYKFHSCLSRFYGLERLKRL
jgi:hypothetical protein